jgi:hexokinase
MGLAQEAARVAAEFEYSDDQVNKAVKAFIRQMGMSTALKPPSMGN